MVVSFFLNVAFRFFLVLYAEGFVKRGNLEVKLLKQIYWLVWVVLVIIGLIPFAIAPIVVGDFPRDKFRAELCLGIASSDGENTNGSSHLFLRNFLQPQFAMALMAFYMVRFVHRVKKFVRGQWPRGKMSAIGKYQRNVIDLNTTYVIALILHCFTFVIKFLRQPTQNLDKSSAFLINFIVFDSFIYILSCCVFLYARKQDMPDRTDAAKHVEFYISKIQVLAPRTPDNFCCHDLNQTDIPRASIVKLGYLKDTKNQAGSNSSKTILPNNLASFHQNFNLKPKNCDRFWIRRKIVDNKTHPRVTIYNSKAEPTMRATDGGFNANQVKRKDPSRKVSKDLEMPPIVSDYLSSFDFALQNNPTEVFEYPAKVLRVNVKGKEEQLKWGTDTESLHRFAYFSKISH